MADSWLPLCSGIDFWLYIYIYIFLVTDFLQLVTVTTERQQKMFLVTVYFYVTKSIFSGLAMIDSMTIAVRQFYSSVMKSKLGKLTRLSKSWSSLQ